MTLLNLILGGNMSSRLFQAIREDLGLAYMIYSSARFLSDTGLMSVHAQTGPEHLEAMLQGISREFRRLKDEGLAAEDVLMAAGIKGIPDKDPWDGEVRYHGEGQHFTLKSPGPDGKWGTRDDITIADGQIERPGKE